MQKIVLQGWHCGRCGHDWVPTNKDEVPKVCPYCKSPYWNKPRVRKIKKG